MRPSLAKKLFASHLGLTAVVLLATLALARWSFDRGFDDYRNAMEEERLGRLAEALVELYRANGNNWESLTPAVFSQLKRTSRPLPKRPRAANRLPRKESDAKYSKRRRGRIPSTALLDVNGEFIAGDRLDDLSDGYTSRVDVMVEGKLIGQLCSVHMRRFDSPPETRFRHQQTVSSLLTAAVMLLLAAGVSYLLTRLMTRPLGRIATSIRQLSSGNYTSKLVDTKSVPPNGDEIQRLMLDLDRLTDTLEENRNARRRWLADTTHELRTPLTVLVGDVAALRDGIRPFENDQLESLERSTTRLHMLVEDLQQLAISDAGGLRYRFESIDLRDLVEQAVQTYRNRPENQMVMDVVGLNTLPMQADPHRLAQLFDNLLANSLAYTDTPGRVLVTVASEQGNATLTFDDSAPNVDADESERIFDPLYRQELSRSRHHAGAGLGLAICRNIVRAHHGSISAAHSPLGGLRILVQLPLDLPQADSTENTPQ